MMSSQSLLIVSNELHSINNRHLQPSFIRSPPSSLAHHQPASLDQQPASHAQLRSITTIFIRSTTAIFSQSPPSSLNHHHLLSINNRQLLASFTRSPPASIA
jgi:hypothetical protein